MCQLLVTNTLVSLTDRWISQSAALLGSFTCPSPQPVQSGAPPRRVGAREPALSVSQCRDALRNGRESWRWTEERPLLQVRTRLLTVPVREEMRRGCEEDEDEDADTHTHTHVPQCRRTRLSHKHRCLALMCVIMRV